MEEQTSHFDTCPECLRPVLSTWRTCPCCGYPIVLGTHNHKNVHWKIIILCLLLLLSSTALLILAIFEGNCLALLRATALTTSPEPCYAFAKSHPNTHLGNIANKYYIERLTDEISTWNPTNLPPLIYWNNTYPIEDFQEIILPKITEHTDIPHLAAAHIINPKLHLQNWITQAKTTLINRLQTEANYDALKRIYTELEPYPEKSIAKVRIETLYAIPLNLFLNLKTLAGANYFLAAYQDSPKYAEVLDFWQEIMDNYYENPPKEGPELEAFKIVLQSLEEQMPKEPTILSMPPTQNLKGSVEIQNELKLPFLLRLRNQETGALVEDIFMPPKSSYKGRLPQGEYTLSYTTGPNWYGELMFGPYAEYATFDRGFFIQFSETLVFRFREDRRQNTKSTIISKEDF